MNRRKIQRVNAAAHVSERCIRVASTVSRFQCLDKTLATTTTSAVWNLSALILQRNGREKQWLPGPGIEE